MPVTRKRGVTSLFFYFIYTGTEFEFQTSELRAVAVRSWARPQQAVGPSRSQPAVSASPVTLPLFAVKLRQAAIMVVGATRLPRFVLLIAYLFI
jgi:hypothetical protein